MSKSNYTKYKDEIRDLRKLLNDDDYCTGGECVTPYQITDYSNEVPSDSVAINYLDSPNTTSQVTYKTQFKRNSGSGNYYICVNNSTSIN